MTHPARIVPAFKRRAAAAAEAAQPKRQRDARGRFAKKAVAPKKAKR